MRRLFALLALTACGSTPRPPTPAPATLAAAESLYADLRELRDRIDVTIAADRTTASDGTPLGRLIQYHDALGQPLEARLAAIDSSSLQGGDARALGIMRRTLTHDLGPVAESPASGAKPNKTHPDCAYDARKLAALPLGLDSLRTRLYSCYGWAQSHVILGADTLDRLSVLGALGRTHDVNQRRRLFLSLVPVWRSINGDNTALSPYRQLITQEVKERGTRESPARAQARATGVPPDSLEGWLIRVLETWRAATPDSLVEPWDWYYENGRTSRRLSPRISRERLAVLNAEVYRALGADVEALRIRYDLEPREGKTPVAFCTFGGRPRLLNGAWTPGEPSVFATYRIGGLDNLSELLHETGHAIHIAAIRTRPAFADWPDSDPFTEAVADFVALDVAEPLWQQHWLGDSVPLADGLRSRYSGIVLDIAWAIFEMQMQRDPAADPNELWTALTRNYLRIRPHPELSWWAMRGQLVSSPGYMMNYAAGSILIAAIRARTRALHGSFVPADPSWYAWVAPRLFRFGLERPTREVVEEFLGGPVTPTALLSDMRRMNLSPTAPRISPRPAP
ncbi:MAG: hypothetical protein H0T90_03640 [Gemmatimonadales bacterium]|nr:hypothetical protein [Gemmatimonadales bacterium]